MREYKKGSAGPRPDPRHRIANTERAQQDPWWLNQSGHDY